LSPLSGKRVAIAGLEPAMAARIVAALDDGDAFCRRVSDLDAVPGSNALGNYDILVASPSAASPWFDRARRVMERPVLVAGSTLALGENLIGLTTRDVDFMIDTASDDEIRLRASRLMLGNVGRPKQAVGRAPIIVSADDDVTVAAIVKQLLTSDGMTVYSAPDGAKALALVREVRPDLAVLDVQMPGMTGFEVLTAIKAEAEISGTRVVLLTSAEQESDVMRGFALGAADYVVKPFNPIELLVRIRRFVRRS
jgi:CheY-like chemotaxis protein